MNERKLRLCVGGFVFAGGDEAGGGGFGLVPTVAHQDERKLGSICTAEEGENEGNISPSRQKFNSEINQREQQKLHLLHSIHLIITIFYLYTTTSHESSRSCCARTQSLPCCCCCCTIWTQARDSPHSHTIQHETSTHHPCPPPPIRQDPELWPLEMKVDKEAQQAIRHECVCPYLFGGNQNRMK